MASKLINIPRSSQKEIAELFTEKGSYIYSKTDIGKIFQQGRHSWRIAESVTVAQFIKYLIAKISLVPVDLQFPSRKEKRYIYGETTPFHLALSIKKDAYLSHYTSMYLHSLTDQIPKMIYVNKEQTPKQKSQNEMTQDGIDLAFKRPQRISKYMAEYNEYKICLLNGKNTNNLGVYENTDLFDQPLLLTDIERTLIDICVRPEYAGGYSEVLNAFQNAHDRVSINRLLSYYSKMDYVYPYHQVIGFYLERSGSYSERQIDFFRKLEKKFDFYLTYNMQNTEYSKEWRLYYPGGM